MDSRKPQRDRIRGVIKTKKVDGNSGQPSWRFAASASTLSPRPPAARRPLREVSEEAAHSPLGRRKVQGSGRVPRESGRGSSSRSLLGLGRRRSLFRTAECCRGGVRACVRASGRVHVTVRLRV